MTNPLIPGDEKFMKEPLPIRFTIGLENAILALFGSLGPPRHKGVT